MAGLSYRTVNAGSLHRAQNHLNRPSADPLFPGCGGWEANVADNQKWIERIRQQINCRQSKAADYWDSLRPEMRGLVLHAASLSGSQNFSHHLSGCNWRELYGRVDSRGMVQLRTGIQMARDMFEGFGSLSRSSFTRRTTQRAVSKVSPVCEGQEMVIAPHIILPLLAVEQGSNTSGEQQ